MYRSIVLAIAFALATVSVAQAQQGTITGQVVDAGTQGPIALAQVSIPGLNLGALTGADGRYQLGGVPAGTHTLLVQIIGYGNQEATVTVTSGGTVQQNFQLTGEALAMDELLVVGYTTQSRRSVAGSVSSVDASDIQARKVATVQDALRGQVAGVNVRNSGEPGQTANIVIRGSAFTQDNEPLYVVDGMYTRELRELNPADIESIQVLKDASAASQYGAQAANGVIVITTKKGRASDGNRIQIRSSYGFSDMYRFIPMMNSQQWAELNEAKYEQARVIDPTSPTAPAGVFEVYNGVNTFDTDWQREVTQSGHLQDHQLSLSGGTEDGSASYFVSGGYADQQGTIIQTGFDRMTMRVNSQASRGKLTVGENLQLSRSNIQDPTASLGQALDMIPPIPVYNTPEGNYGTDAWGHGTANYPTFATNPVGAAMLVDDERERNEAFGTVFGQVNLVEGLDYRLQVGFRFNEYDRRSFSETGTLRQNTARGPANLTVDNNRTTDILLENLLSYNRVIGVHNINAVVGYTQNRVRRRNLTAYRSNFPDENLRVLDAGSLEISNGEQKIESALNSYLGRVSYSLMDRYTTDLSFRRDGSSRFGPANRWGNFWSASLGWVMSDEAFFADLPLIGGADLFRLRGSYGTQGNQDFADYEWQALVSGAGGGGSTRAAGNAYLRGPGEGSLYAGNIPLTLGNPRIKWQDNTMKNIGLDMGLMNNQLAITAEYYTSESGGLLARVPLVASVGSASDPFVNAGSIKNSGVEFTIRHTYSRPDFELNTGLNLSHNSNEVLELGGGETEIIDGASRTAVGGPLGSLYMYETCGVFQSDSEAAAHGSQPNAGGGDLCFVDHNSDGQIDDQDRTTLGNPWPDLEGGLFFDGRFRDFDFAVGFHGSFGNDVYSTWRPGPENMVGDSNAPTWLDPWTPSNPSTTTPRALWGGPGVENGRGPNDRYLEDGSYIKLQNVQVGYRLPSSLLSFAGLELDNARVYLNLQDISVFTDYLGYDPEFRGGTLDPGESGTGYPNPRTITVGVDLGF